jgi:hypothetical protein
VRKRAPRAKVLGGLSDLPVALSSKPHLVRMMAQETASSIENAMSKGEGRRLFHQGDDLRKPGSRDDAASRDSPA